MEDSTQGYAVIFEREDKGSQTVNIGKKKRESHPFLVKNKEERRKDIQLYH